MNFKEKYNEGNSFILSPNGVISRTRYLLYALLLDILYRVFNSIGGVLGKEISWLFYIVGLIIIPILILKLFNYKKRAYSFLNNHSLSYLYSVVYMLLGVLTQGYVYLLKLSNQKAIYELTQDSTFQHYANINVPSFIGVEGCNILFYILCGLGFIMFLTLLFIPSKGKNEKQEVAEIVDTNNLTKYDAFINKTEVTKAKNYKWLIFIPTIILYLVLVHIAYSEIHWRAYSRMSYIMNEKEVNYSNEINKFEYERKLNEYNAKEMVWKDCIQRHPDLYVRLSECRNENSALLSSVKPEKPFYYEYNSKDYYPNRVLRREHYDLFGCELSNFSLLSYKCGDLTFNDNNRFFTAFHPYAWLISVLILLLPISFYICKLISFLIKALINKVKRINFKGINSVKFKFPSNNKSNLTQKLEELNKLKEQGLITEEDYNNKKAKLLEDF